MGEIHVRPIAEEDTSRIIDLLRRSLGEGAIPRDAGYWNWKHRRSPFGVSPGLLAEHDGRIVGLRVFLRWTFLRDGVLSQAVRAVDTATDPDWQGRGIFSRLTLQLVAAMEQEGVSFVFNTPNRFSRPGYLKMGWESAGRISMLIRPLRPLRLVGMLAKRGEPSSPTTDLRELHGDVFDLKRQLQRPELTRLLDSIPRGAGYSTQVSPAYLHWRYAEIPGFTYGATGSWQAGEEALVVFRLRARGGLSELRICELFVAPGRAAVQAAVRLIRMVLRDTRTDIAAAIAAPGSHPRNALRIAGFVPAPRLGPILTVRSLNGSPNCDKLTRRANWHMSIGDLELF